MSHEPYDATLGNNATLGDDNAKLGADATPLLTMTATTKMAVVAAAAAVARRTKTRR